MAENPQSAKRSRPSLLNRLTSKYRLVILNDESFEEVTSFRLSRLNIYILLSTVLVILVLITTSAIIYTPVKEYIPGYSDVNVRKDILTLSIRSDSLQKVLHDNDVYLQNLKNIISGNVVSGNGADSSHSSAVAMKYDSINLNKISPSEASLRQQVEKEGRFTVSGASVVPGQNFSTIRSFHFFTPLKGYITNDFDPKKNHYGVDIVSPENEPVKATLDGIVVFAGWTSETGYVMAIQHSNNLISLYKHNSVLFKEEGNYVKAGDVIAIVGNTGELTSGPHLHFELWYNGVPINPKDYIVFN